MLMGKVYEGTVVKILDNNVGAIVTVMPGKDGLVHISEIAHERLKNVFVMCIFMSQRRVSESFCLVFK